MRLPNPRFWVTRGYPDHGDSAFVELWSEKPRRNVNLATGFVSFYLPEYEAIGITIEEDDRESTLLKWIGLADIPPGSCFECSIWQHNDGGGGLL